MKTHGYIVVPVRSAAVRWGACAAIVLAAAWGAVSVTQTAVSESILYLMARHPLPPQALVRAYELAPENPDASYRLALYNMDVAAKPDYDAAGRLLDESRSLAPNRFQTWLALGRRSEIVGHNAEAEQAYLRAANLAPSFWKPQWALGNLYIRQGRLQEGVESLRYATDRNPELGAMATRTVWHTTGGDLDLTARAAGSSLRGRSELVGFFLSEHRIDAALASWTDLTHEHAGDESVIALGRSIAGALVAAGRVDEAIGIWSRITPDAAPVMDRLQNPGFDEPVTERPGSPFTWTVTQSPEARVSLDAGRLGGGALRVDYSVRGGGGFGHATQYVHVRPGVSYTLSFWARTADLQSGGLPRVSVSDTARRESFSVAQSLPLGTSEWTEYRIRFEAPASGLIAVGVGRASCGEVCPIYGAVWIDDLSLVAN
jgi:hypothetical protein